MPATTYQIIAGASNSAVSNSASNYFCPSGGCNAQTSESVSAGIMPTAGVIKKLRVNLSAAPGAGGSGKKYNITIYKNGSPTTLTVELLETATLNTDLSHEISYSAGDTISLACVPTSTPTSVILNWSLEFIPTTGGETILLASDTAISVNRYMAVFSGLSNTSTEANVQLLVPCSGTFKNLYIKSSAPGGTSTHIFTVRKNGVDQSLAVTLVGAATTGNDVGNNFSVSAGDVITIKKTGTSAGNPNVELGLCFVPDTLGQFILGFSSGSNNLSSGATEYCGLHYSGALGQTTTARRQPFGACTIKSIYVLLTTAPDNGAGTQGWTFTLRKNGSTQLLTLSLTEAQTSGNYSTDISIADDDLIDTAKTITGTPTQSPARISYIGYITPTAVTTTKTITSDSHIQVIGEQKTILSDANITSISNKLINSDAIIKAIGIQENILADAKIVDKYQKSISSDSWIKIILQKTILSDANIVMPILVDIVNYINVVKQVFYNINNDCRTVRMILKNIENKFSMIKLQLKNIRNDYRAKKREIYDVVNDFRFITSSQKSDRFGFQSLGKTFIHVYINSVEIIDVDIDSIKIEKSLNTSHSATFNLGRAYDSTKPSVESTVEIKYDSWTLYKGYITEISPADSPESITIRCQDKYWLDNRTNKYFFVGHKPISSDETYYDTISDALLDEFSWNPGIGNFVPQTKDCFSQPQSDIISSLIAEAGNYGWFYDVDDSKKLVVYGQGSIVNIQRQSLGKNLDLYDLIEHQFNEDISEIVNRFKVQMGDKVISTNRTYSAYSYSSFQGWLEPAWDSDYEKMAKYSSDGYGWDYPEPGYEKEYGEVFKKYYLPTLDSDLSSWSDRYPPKIEIHSPGGYLYSAIGTITEGFSIDYENRTITFNEAQFLYQSNQYGELTAVRSPLLKLFLWKKNYYSFTLDELSNPLMFFTAKMGTYPTTITKDLNLSTCSIQVVSYSYIDSNGVERIIPSWDDTAFAEDYANWQLSKICDKKINGNIIITLDAACFYNLDLTKRIFIEGITETPMNIVSISYDLSSFRVNIELQNLREYQRTISLPSHGE